MPETETLDARLAAVRDRTSKILAVASPTPDLMRANEAVHHAVAVLLRLHSDEPVYLGADECGCSEPHDGAARDDWEDDHPPGAGDVGRICKKADVGRYCPACTELVHGQDYPLTSEDEDYASAPCSVRSLISRVIMGEREPSGNRH
jgi:hypothetical protein